MSKAVKPCQQMDVQSGVSQPALVLVLVLREASGAVLGKE